MCRAVNRLSLSLTGTLVLVLVIGALVVAEPVPGAVCTGQYVDTVNCNSTYTLLSCSYEGDNQICKCVAGIDDLPYNGANYDINTQWNSTAGKCMSIANSICNLDKETMNYLPVGGGYSFVSLECMEGLICKRNNEAYPEGVGVCGSTALTVFNGLILFSALSLNFLNI